MTLLSSTIAALARVGGWVKRHPPYVGCSVKVVEYIANGVEHRVQLLGLGVEGWPELQGVATEAHVETGVPQFDTGLERTDHRVAITRADLDRAGQAAVADVDHVLAALEAVQLVFEDRREGGGLLDQVVAFEQLQGRQAGGAGDRVR